MAVEVCYDPEHDCVLCTATGSMDLDSLEEYLGEVLKVMAEHECPRLLQDVRGVDLALSTVDLYELPSMVYVTGMDLMTRRAIVGSRQLHDYLFYEAVASNQGHTVKVFRDPDEALEWLKAAG